MTKDVKAGRISIETISTVATTNDVSPNSKKRYLKNELNDTDVNMVDTYKKKLEKHKDILHDSMTKFLNSIYEELENSRINLESSCLKSLKNYGDSLKKLELLKNQNKESLLKLQKMQEMTQKFTDKINGF